MKRKIILIVMMSLLIAGCGKNKEEEPPVVNYKEVEKPKVDANGVYSCSQKDDGLETYKWEYKNNELVKIEYINVLDKNEKMDSVKNKVSSYDGVSIVSEKVKNNDGYKITMDVSKNGASYLRDNDWKFSAIHDFSWENISKIMDNGNFVCK